MARESGSRGVMPAIAVGIGTGRTDGCDPTDDLDARAATARPQFQPQFHPNHATEA